MIRHLHGVINGNKIELDVDPGLPPGTPVNVHLEGDELSLEERRRRVREACGAWKHDDSIETIFNEILEERRRSTPRPIDLDASS